MMKVGVALAVLLFASIAHAQARPQVTASPTVLNFGTQHPGGLDLQTVPPLALSTLAGQARRTDKPNQEMTFKVQLRSLGRTKKDGYMSTEDKYAASDGNTLFVTVLFLRTPENAKKKFEEIVQTASEITEQKELHDEKSGVLTRRAVLSGPDPNGLGGKMILLLPESSAELYEITASSLDDALEFERQKVK